MVPQKLASLIFFVLICIFLRTQDKKNETKTLTKRKKMSQELEKSKHLNEVVSYVCIDSYTT